VKAPAQLHGSRARRTAGSSRKRAPRRTPARRVAPDDRQPRDLAGEQLRRAFRNCTDSAISVAPMISPCTSSEGNAARRWFSQDQHGSIWADLSPGSSGEVLTSRGFDLPSAQTPPGRETCIRPPSPGTGCSRRPRSSPTMSLSLAFNAHADRWNETHAEAIAAGEVEAKAAFLVRIHRRRLGHRTALRAGQDRRAGPRRDAPVAARAVR
jgi:hypothetical protein